MHRLYRAEGLAVRRRGRKRGPAGRGVLPNSGSTPNESWCLDFVRDAVASGRRLRVLAVLDTGTREALGIEVDTSRPAVRVVGVLDQLVTERGTPHVIVRDNGPELTSRVLDQWAYQHGVQLPFIDPGTPIQNAFSERCNGRLRDECRNAHWFTSLADAQLLIEAWRRADHRGRLHSALGYQTPEEVYQEFVRPCEPVTTPAGCSDELVQQPGAGHVSVALHGLLRLGIYATDEAGSSRWVCLDADTTADFTGLGTLAACMEESSVL
jgi:putative transposase